MSNRRAFLKFLAGSPLLAGASSIVESLAQQAPPSVIDKAADALDVFEFEAAARTLGLYGDGSRRRGYAPGQPRRLQPLPIANATLCRCQPAGHVDGSLRHEGQFADYPLPRRKSKGIPSGRRSRGCESGE